MNSHAAWLIAAAVLGLAVHVALQHFALAAGEAVVVERAYGLAIAQCHYLEMPRDFAPSSAVSAVD